MRDDAAAVAVVEFLVDAMDLGGHGLHPDVQCPGDFALMRRVRLGDTPTANLAASRRAGELFRRPGAYTEAEDVAQEIFLRVWRW
ncbi:MAG: hypothetical protein EPN23_05105 [Verrucomicrobia bacterium]|nr:MAG: hypothetical protein EPN23_05105 [Verrucomicrobiota bacterium]